MITASFPFLRPQGPILVFGGPYSNAQALDAVLAEAQARSIPAANIISTGDLVAYCADSSAVVRRVRAADLYFVRGNCEEQLAAGAPDCGCGFTPGGACERLSIDWYAYALRQLTAEERAYLGAAPERIMVEINGVSLAIIHGAATKINRFVYPSTPSRVKAYDLDSLRVDGIIAGHSGLPFTQFIDGRLWHNPGALGMPANDGTPRVWFSVISPGGASGEIVIEHCALNYDFQAAADAMRAAGLPPDYAKTLESGLWPNCDSLGKQEAKAQGVALQPEKIVFSRNAMDADFCLRPAFNQTTPLDPKKFSDPSYALNGQPRGFVDLTRLETFWINTGTLCNLACGNCYIESSPRNDRLSYMSAAEAGAFFDEIQAGDFQTKTIGFTGGEPFMNPDMIAMLDDALSRGFEVLALTNAMKPMRKSAGALCDLRDRFGDKLTLRVSLDHYEAPLHELERGIGSFASTVQGLVWLMREKFRVTLAGRLFSGEPEGLLRAGYAALFAAHNLALDAFSTSDLVLFPEMAAEQDAPEITEKCWEILHKDKREVMCATSRMAVKRKGHARPVIVACTLLPYDPAFELGPTLKDADRAVILNHPHCATFCVLGGASCSNEK